MSIEDWNSRYRAGEQLFDTPSPLVREFTKNVRPGTALDLACGPGRHAIYLARLGWKVTAVDGSSIAIATLRDRARQENLDIDAIQVDLESRHFKIQPDAHDLILDCYYLQRDLFQPIRLGARNGGLVIAIVHLADPDQPSTATRAQPGELRSHFEDWPVLHYYEGQPHESCHRRAVAELVARKPS